jgi:alkanesulfonate monooxygenase SsuD/methylene tetrahydromethanopterin reductase-like flavin-dependent oxidoreductase (luciferase family)
VVGGSSPAIITLAAQHADGVNIHRLPADVMAARVEHARTASQDRDFEISVHDTLDPDHPLGGDPAPLAALGVHRRTLAVTSPFPIDAIEEIAERLRRV